MRGQLQDVIVDEVDVKDVWVRLSSESRAVLIDVRTHAEWTWVGVPDLSSIGKEPLFLEWQIYPERIIDGLFTQKLASQLEQRSIGHQAELFFICRSGVRSQAAAKAMILSGYATSCNVTKGFEGDPDHKRHRGNLNGWKAAGLPWVQS